MDEIESAACGGSACTVSNKMDEYSARVSELLRSSTAGATRSAYKSQLKLFLAWCDEAGVRSFPADPAVVASYIAALDRKGASVSTVLQAMAAISAAHRAKGLVAPTESMLVRKILLGYKREHGTAQRKKDAATVDVIRLMLDALSGDGSVKAVRDMAIISLGFAGAFRRSELSALNVSNMSWNVRNGIELLLVNVARSKTDPEGAGIIKAIFPARKERYSPTALMKQWLAAAPASDGAPLFREIRRGGYVTDRRLSGQSIGIIVKGAASRAGLSLDISAHSLRSGFVTTAIRQGKSERSIMNQTGHRSVIVLREYFRREDAIEDNAANGVI